jgi:hypothetical protein
MTASVSTRLLRGGRFARRVGYFPLDGVVEVVDAQRSRHEEPKGLPHPEVEFGDVRGGNESEFPGRRIRAVGQKTL